MVATGSTASTVSNDYCIPIAIYGIKTTASVKVSAIASDVNTAADHCMLSDGVTSVEDGMTQYIGDTLLTTIDTYNASWEATANGWCVGYIFSSSDHSPIVSIDGVEIIRSGGSSSAANLTFPVCFPIKKGQTITTRNDSATSYNIKVLAMG